MRYQDKIEDKIARMRAKATRAQHAYEFEGVSEFVKESEWELVENGQLLYLQKKIVAWYEGDDQEFTILFKVDFDEHGEVDYAEDLYLGGAYV